MTLAQHRVLIVEDDLMIADAAEEFLLKCGYDVCGIARTTTEAIALGRLHAPDLVVIDLRLADGGLGTDVASELIAQGRRGILYASANLASFSLDTVNGDACLAKPYTPNDLLRSLEIVADIVASGRPSEPFPQGFRVLPLAARHADDRMYG